MDDLWGREWAKRMILAAAIEDLTRRQTKQILPDSIPLLKAEINSLAKEWKLQHLFEV